MDFEKEARELLTEIFGGQSEWGKSEVNSSVATLRRACAAGQENMKERAAALIDNGFDREVADHWAKDKLPSKFDMCEHGRQVNEDCEQCCSRAIRAIPIELAPKVNEFTPLATTKDIGLE